MRYAAVSAVVFGGALFLASGNQASSPDAAKTITAYKSPATNISQIISASQHISASTSSRPHVLLASAAKPAKAAQPSPVTVQEGDSLTRIAEAHGSTTKRLFDANPGISDPNIIYPGQELRVPAANETLASRPMPAPAAAVTEAVQSVTSPTPHTGTTAPAPAAASVAGGSVWDSLAQCESGGNWAINTGNGFYGGLQFTLATWQGLGGSGLPSQASREEQIARAEMLLARSGWGQWPACTAKLGLR